MGDKNIIDLVQGDLSFVERLYDSIRIVDPTTKHVHNYENERMTDTQHICYQYWEQSKLCNNCISMRSYNENDTFIKVERKGNRMIMITAVPVNFNGKKMIVELLKDITKNIVYGNDEHENITQINSIVKYLNEIAVKDGLTDLYNRRYIDERLPVDIVLSAIDNRPLSLIMLDIDHFKKVNDTYGHVAGDHVLKEIAKIIESCVRAEIDWVARYGGEEFLVCLLNTNTNDAREVAERMRQKISEGAIEYNSRKIKITASFGVCSIFKDIVTSDKLIECVDKKLYEAKKAGRDKVV